jgi:hypothetical protein
MRWLILVSAVGSVACASAQAEPSAPTSERAEPAEDTPFACDDIEGLCDEGEPAEPSPQASAVCPELTECQARCTRGDAASCLEAFRLGRGAMSRAVGQELIERACVLGNAHACILSNDVDARDPRTGHTPPPR